MSRSSHPVSLVAKLEMSIIKLDLGHTASMTGSKWTFFFLFLSGKRSLCNLQRLTEGSTVSTPANDETMHLLHQFK